MSLTPRAAMGGTDRSLQQRVYDTIRRRAAALENATRKGRLTHEHAQSLLPMDRGQALANVEMLTGPHSPIPPKIKAQLLSFVGGKKP